MFYFRILIHQYSAPVAPTESTLLQLPPVGPSVNVFCEAIGMELSTRCTDSRRKLHSFEYSGHTESNLGLRVFAVSAVHETEILRVHDVPNPESVFSFSKVSYLTPRYWEHLWNNV